MPRYDIAAKVNGGASVFQKQEIVEAGDMPEAVAKFVRLLENPSVKTKSLELDSLKIKLAGTEDGRR